MVSALYDILLLACELGMIAAGRQRSAALWLYLLQPGAAAVLAKLIGEDYFGVLRLFSHGVFIHAPLLLLVLGTHRTIHRWLRVAVLAGAATVAAIGVDACLIEPHALEVTHMQLRSPKLTRRLRIALLADIQLRTLDDYSRAELRRVLEQAPDLILFAGDYVQADGNAAERSVERELGDYLASIHLAAPLGVYAVQGNVDAADWAVSFEPIRATTFPVTASVQTGEVEVTGLSIHDSFDPTLRVAGSPRFHIVFGHAPDFARGHIDADLLLAGHTHGGQVRLPGYGPLITFSTVPRSWAAGATQLGAGRTLIVSRGIGVERGYAPELRFLCRPQIVIVEVEPSAPQAPK